MVRRPGKYRERISAAFRNETDWDRWDDLVDNPSVVKVIIFAETLDQSIYVGFEGALLRSKDDGETWETLIRAAKPLR